MAYAAVASLLQTLEYLLQFPSFVFETMKIRCSGKPSSTWKSVSLMGYNLMLECDKIRRGREIREDILELSALFAELFQNNMNTAATPRSNQQSQLLKELEESIVSWVDVGTLASLCKVTLEMAVIQHHLRSLLTGLDDSSEKCDDHELLNSIKDVSYRTRDLVEECLMENPIESAVAWFFDRNLRNIPDLVQVSNSEMESAMTSEGSRTIVKEEVAVADLEESMVNSLNELAVASSSNEEFSNVPTEEENRVTDLLTVIMNVFRGKKGIHLVEAFEELRSMELQIKTIRKKGKDTNEGILSSKLSGMSSRDSGEKKAGEGLDDEQLRILGGLTGLPSSLEIVTIVGMGGIGKTTLARKLFRHPYTGHHFYCRAWITISQTHELRKILLGLLSSFVQTTDEIMEKSIAQLAEDVYRSLKGRRYLIVMDDMWSIDAWNEVKRCFPDDKIGSRIIITSRFTELANHAYTSVDLAYAAMASLLQTLDYLLQWPRSLLEIKQVQGRKVLATLRDLPARLSSHCFHGNNGFMDV